MNPPKMLIADGEPALLISLEFRKKRAGYQVVLARDGQEAIDAIVRECPEQVLPDVMVPIKTAFDVCHGVRGNDVATGPALGASAHPTLPLSIKEQVPMIGELLTGAPGEAP